MVDNPVSVKKKRTILSNFSRIQCLALCVFVCGQCIISATAMGIVTKWAITIRTSDFYGPSPSTSPPAPDARLCPPPPLRADFCSMTCLHALPLYQTLLWKMGNWETYGMENAPLPISYFSHCHPPKETGKLRAYWQERGKLGNGNPPPLGT